MEAAGVPYKHLKQYILALDCDSCAVATGCRHNTGSTVRIEVAQVKKRLKAQRKLAAQQKRTSKTSKPTTTVDSVLEISPITDAQNPKMTITESLARLFGHTAFADEFDYSTFAAIKPTQGHCAHDCADNLRCLDDILSATTTSQPVPVIEKEVETTTKLSPPGNDLRMDWADACSLDRSQYLDRYFLLILDKGTEHWATYPTKI